MQIKELDPTKKYIVSISNEYVTKDDLEAIRDKLKPLCADVVVVAGADIESDATYWGVYFPATKQWAKETQGRLIFYPSEHIARASAQEYIDKWPELGKPVAREFDESVGPQKAMAAS